MLEVSEVVCDPQDCRRAITFYTNGTVKYQTPDVFIQSTSLESMKRRMRNAATDSSLCGVWPSDGEIKWVIEVVDKAIQINKNA